MRGELNARLCMMWSFRKRSYEVSFSWTKTTANVIIFDAFVIRMSDCSRNGRSCLNDSSLYEVKMMTNSIHNVVVHK